MKGRTEKCEIAHFYREKRNGEDLGKKNSEKEDESVQLFSDSTHESRGSDTHPTFQNAHGTNEQKGLSSDKKDKTPGI